MFCATPAALDEYFDKKAIEGGNITRTVLCKLSDELGEEGAKFKPYTREQHTYIDRMLSKLLEATYNDAGGLQPTVKLDMTWLDKTVCKWVRGKGKEASLSGNQALDVFRKRSSVSAYRIAALCQYLYGIEDPEERSQPLEIQKRVKQIYLYMAEYILQSMLERWGQQFEDLTAKRELSQKAGPKECLYDKLTDTFTRDQLKALIEKLGKITPHKVFLSRWKKLRVIEVIDKNTFRKLRIKN